MKEFNRAIRVFRNITLITSSILDINVLRDIWTSQLSSPGFGLQTTCIVTFCVMFLPRSRQLTAMGNGGVYLEDQEDQLSLHHDQEELTYNQVSHVLYYSHWSSYNEARLSLVESFIMKLCQQHYAIKNQLEHPKTLRAFLLATNWFFMAHW